MKRLAVVAVLVLVLAFVLAISPALHAACTEAHTVLLWKVGDRVYEQISVVWTADATPATCTFTLTEGTSGSFVGYITSVETVPGGTAPTTLYDIVLRRGTSAGVDVMGGALANRSATLAEQEMPTVGTFLAPFPRWINGTVYVAITNNSVSSSSGTIIFNLER